MLLFQNQNQGNSSATAITVFVGNITERASDALVRQILTKCGLVVNWKRVQGAKGKLQGEKKDNVLFFITKWKC